MADEPGGLKASLVWTGGSSILVATLGLVSVLVVGRWQGPLVYASFAVAWGLFFGIGGVFAGLQQEVMRSVTGGHRGDGLRLLPTVLALGLGVGVGACLLYSKLTPDPPPAGPYVIGLGLIGLAGMTLLGGVLAAREDWSGLAVVLVLDALVRTLLIALLAGVGRSSLFPLGIVAGALAWPALLLNLRFRSALAARVDSGMAMFLRRALEAMAATGCAALMVAGLPVLVATLRTDSLNSGVGSVLAALVIIRSVLLVPVYGYRPVILRAFLTAEPTNVVLWTIWAWCTVAGVAWTGLVWLIGPPFLQLLLGASFSVTPTECAALAFGAFGLMLLVISGLALVAQDRHRSSVTGWGLALLCTLTLIAVADDARSSVTLAAFGGPWVGVLVHTGFLTRRTSMSRSERPSS